MGTNLPTNNIAFERSQTNLDSTTIQFSNSWQHFTVSAADFASLDISLAFTPRNLDYSLASNALLCLAPGSRLMDAGANVGLPYHGTAPDLGAFEYIPAEPPVTPFRIISMALAPTNKVQIVWETVSNKTYRGESRDSLHDTAWTLRQLVTATNALTEYIEPVACVTQRSFRIVCTNGVPPE